MTPASPAANQAVVVAAARTPIGTAYKGSLVEMDGMVLGARAVREVLRRSGIPAEHFDDVVVQIHAADIPREIGEREFQAIYRNDNAHILTGDVNKTIEHLLHFDIPLNRLRIRARDLEDLFLELTGKELRA